MDNDQEAAGGNPRIVVIGAGISGLVCARALTAAGHTVKVLEKARGVGGRMATRRIGGARLDHGAQFFTVRSNEFQALIDAAMADGIVVEWCRGFEGTGDGFPRYRCANGMTDFAKWLAVGLDVVTGERVNDLRDYPAAAYIVTSPIPQSLELFAASGVTLDASTDTALRSVTYDPTMALLVHLDSPSAIPLPGAVPNPDPTFTFVTDNQIKGISAEPAVTLHVNPELSRLRWDDERETVIANLLEAARPWIGPARVLDSQLMKWRYATPLNPLPDSAMVVAEDPVVVVAGDAFGGPKVEGAFLSGEAAAKSLIAQVS